MFTLCVHSYIDWNFGYARFIIGGLGEARYRF